MILILLVLGLLHLRLVWHRIELLSAWLTNLLTTLIELLLRLLRLVELLLRLPCLVKLMLRLSTLVELHLRRRSLVELLRRQSLVYLLLLLAWWHHLLLRWRCPLVLIPKVSSGPLLLLHLLRMLTLTNVLAVLELLRLARWDKVAFAWPCCECSLILHHFREVD